MYLHFCISLVVLDMNRGHERGWLIHRTVWSQTTTRGNFLSWFRHTCLIQDGLPKMVHLLVNMSQALRKGLRMSSLLHQPLPHMSSVFWCVQSHLQENERLKAAIAKPTFE
ncbi:MICAL-like protein 1 [Frankliniella fusca]|uniref:MICAL-like protein 1 n=1 Tax=Frankliniella fusca TaxID=407009 RepID=A0AAE1H4H6_9NEOP|nr:MICAL-like protein 1 [Frankliniella fusca]